MSSEGKFRAKLLLTVLLLWATLGAQTSALGAEQETHHGSQHCCRLCHIGAIPILPAAAVAVAAPLFSTVWMSPSGGPAAPHEALLPAAPSRAPPA